MAREHKASTILKTHIARMANGIIAAAACGCIATLGYFFYYYGWTHQRYFAGWGGPLLSYIVPAVLAGLLLATFWLPGVHRINIRLVVCATVGALYLAEIGLTFFAKEGMSLVEKAKAAGIVYDT